jgi:hypothetical protein
MITPGTNPYVIEKNLEMMISTDEGGMIGLLFEESIAGNAGEWYGLPCSGANFVFDNQTGEIIYFQNHQSLPLKLKNKPHGVVKVALDLQRDDNRNLRIVSYLLDEKELYGSVQKNIEESIRRFNSEYGFRDPSLLEVLE